MAYEAVTKQQEGDPRRQRSEAHVSRQLRQLFDRLPALAGFRLRCDLMVADVSVVRGSSCASRRLHVSLMQALVELAECDPEALVLMRGRRFARSLN